MTKAQEASSVSFDKPLLCLDSRDQTKISKAIKDLLKCQIDLDAKNKLIDERLITYQNTPTTTWWQEPSVIVGGVTVSFCLGALVAYSMTRK